MNVLVKRCKDPKADFNQEASSEAEELFWLVGLVDTLLDSLVVRICRESSSRVLKSNKNKEQARTYRSKMFESTRLNMTSLWSTPKNLPLFSG